MFFRGDPHMVQGDGEVALTAMEGPLRPTFRLTLVEKGRARRTHGRLRLPDRGDGRPLDPDRADHPDGPESGGNATSLDIAMKTAVRHAMAFLTEDVGLAGPVACAYLSAASDFQCSRVVDRTTGITR